MTEQLISYFKSGEFSKVGGEVSFWDYLDNVQSGKWQDVVLQIRAKKKDKKVAPSVTVSGTFEDRRRKNNFKIHSGIIGIDLDIQDNEGLEAKRKDLEADPFCLACHHSIGGFGLVWYVKVKPERHFDSFLAIEKYLANKYQVVVDPSGKDVTRLRYISYDPDLYLNKRAKTWSKYLNKKESQAHSKLNITAYHNDDISYVMDQIQSRGVNIAEDYHAWLHCSFALASGFQEGGRQYFHIVSQASPKYNPDDCDKQYDIALKRQAAGITMGTFFYYCKEAGIETLTEATKATISVYQQRVKMGKDRKEAGKSTIEYMQKMHNVGKERVLPIIKQLDDVPDKAIKEQSVNEKVEELETFIKQQNLRHNEVTGQVELNGEPITDRDVNSIYRMAMHVIDYNISKSKIWDLIDSDIIPSYHPFLEFFERHKNLRPQGRLKEVLDCFEYEKPEDFPEDKDFLEFFLTRWLLGVISSMHGTYSLLVLVLLGNQGTCKTKFFRGLLPQELERYYTENKLDGGKDTDMLMAWFLIIMDDEFGGKSKIESKKFKELSSRDVFYIRRPYGKTFEMMKRYSCLCGTSNDYEVLNDTTGNRRLIPINVINFDYERYEKIDKVELFMELYWMWKEIGDGWMLTGGDVALLNESTSKNEQPTPEEELLQQYFELPTSPNDLLASYLTNTQIRIMLDNISSKGTVIRQKNLGLALAKLGYEKIKRKVNGQVKLVYQVRCNIETSTGFNPSKSPENPDEVGF